MLGELTHYRSASECVVKEITSLGDSTSPSSGGFNFFFFSDCLVGTDDTTVPAEVLRDTRAMQSFILKGIILGLNTGRHILLRGVSGRFFVSTTPI